MPSGRPTWPQPPTTTTSCSKRESAVAWAAADGDRREGEVLVDIGGSLTWEGEMPQLDRPES